MVLTNFMMNFVSKKIMMNFMYNMVSVFSIVHHIEIVVINNILNFIIECSGFGVDFGEIARRK